LDVYHTSTRGVALVRIQNAGLKFAARRLLEMQDPKSPKNRHLGTIAQLSGYIFATKAHIDNRKKNLSNSNVSPICPQNVVNFGH